MHVIVDDRQDLVFAPDAKLLAGFALAEEAVLLRGLDEAAPWPYRVSACKPNCGTLALLLSFNT